MFSKRFNAILTQARKNHRACITIQDIMQQILLLEDAEELCKQTSLDYKTLKKELVEEYPYTNTNKTRSTSTTKRSTGLKKLLIQTLSIAKSNNKKDACILEFLQAFSKAFPFYTIYNNITKNALENEENNASKVSILEDLTQNLANEVQQEYFIGSFEREEEIEQILKILSRKKQRNVLIVGETGSGKTTLVKTLCSKVLKKEVPPQAQDLKFFLLDLPMLIAGTRYRGDFEKKANELIKCLIKEGNAVLVLENMHAIVGAGSSSVGQTDLVSMLKPFLSENKFICIGCTTHAEYTRYLEADKTLTRQFQTVYLTEPTLPKAKKIIYSLLPTYEKFHNVVYTKIAVDTALSLHDKHFKTYPIVDNVLTILDDAGVFASSGKRKGNHVGKQDVKTAVADILNIPLYLEQYKKDELLLLKKELQHAIVGQEEATKTVSNILLRSYMGFHTHEKPIASFLFYGPTGVGKTELAKQIAAILKLPLHRFDMTEYSEAASFAKLIGNNVNILDSKTEGLLIQCVRKTPHCVILLDEVEKAHQDVIQLFLQIMDYGVLTSNNGIKADFCNSIIIMTSNAGANEFYNTAIGFKRQNLTVRENKKLFETFFTPEFRNRFDAIIPFTVLSQQQFLEIVQQKLTSVNILLQQHKLHLEYTKEIAEYIAEQTKDTLYGVRYIQRFIESNIYDAIIEGILQGKYKATDTLRVSIEKTGLSIKVKNTQKKLQKD